jgi:hypothetical protein
MSKEGVTSNLVLRSRRPPCKQAAAQRLWCSCSSSARSQIHVRPERSALKPDNSTVRKGIPLYFGTGVNGGKMKNVRDRFSFPKPLGCFPRYVHLLHRRVTQPSWEETAFGFFLSNRHFIAVRRRMKTPVETDYYLCHSRPERSDDAGGPDRFAQGRSGLATGLSAPIVQSPGAAFWRLVFGKPRDELFESHLRSVRRRGIEIGPLSISRSTGETRSRWQSKTDPACRWHSARARPGIFRSDSRWSTRPSGPKVSRCGRPIPGGHSTPKSHRLGKSFSSSRKVIERRGLV